MRLGILSDIHSNYEALKASYKALEDASCDKIVCLGDVVGYGAKPCECIDFIREKNLPTVRGNHDHYTVSPERNWEIQPYAVKAVQWTKNVLKPEHMEWLASLPFKLKFENVLLVHSSLEATDGEYWPYILDAKAALFHFFAQDLEFAFFGHTHIPLFFTYDENNRISIEILKSRTVASKSARCKYLINPGSVGQPRDFDFRSSVLVFDTVNRSIELLRVLYDVRKVQSEIIEAGLPKILAERLSRGN